MERVVSHQPALRMCKMMLRSAPGCEITRATLPPRTAPTPPISFSTTSDQKGCRIVGSSRWCPKEPLPLQGDVHRFPFVPEPRDSCVRSCRASALFPPLPPSPPSSSSSSLFLSLPLALSLLSPSSSHLGQHPPHSLRLSAPRSSQSLHSTGSVPSSPTTLLSRPQSTLFPHSRRSKAGQPDRVQPRCFSGFSSPLSR